MTRLGSVVVVAAAAVGAACAGARGSARSQQAYGQTPPQADARQAQGAATMMQQCPMAVPGTQVAAADTPQGEAITFTTTSQDQVDDLRSRVRAMADMHNRHMEAHAGMPGGMHDMHGGGMGSAGSGQGGNPMGDAGQGGMGTHMMPPSHAMAEDVDGGARVTITPENLADADRLRSAIRMHVSHMQQTGTCGMDAGMRGPGTQGRGMQDGR